MLITEMRDAFKDQTGSFADNLDDPAVDVFLNNAFAYSIPDLVPGQMSSGVWQFTASDGTSTYAWPSYVYAVRIGAQITPVGTASTQDFSTESFRENEFWIEHDREFTTRQTPYAILHEEDSSLLYPIPDGAHTVYVPARKRPTKIVNDITVLGTVRDPEGIDWHTHANAVVKQAAYEFADRKGLAHVKARIVGSAEEPLSLINSISLMRRRSLSVPKERRRRRTF